MNSVNDPRNPAELAEDPTELQDAVLGLLEEAGIDTETNDKIMKLIYDAEYAKAKAEGFTV